MTKLGLLGTAAVLTVAPIGRADDVATKILIVVGPSNHPPGTHEVAVIGPSTFLKQLFDMDRAVVEERLCDQAKAIGLSIDDLLSRLAGSVPSFVSVFRKQ